MSGRVLPRLIVIGAAVVIFGTISGCGGGQARKVAHMARGQKFLAAQNYDKASVEFQNVLQIDPRDASARYQLGVINEKRGQLKPAVQSYQAAIELAPQHDYLEATTALARLMILNGAAERGLTLIDAELLKHPDVPELLVLRAAALAQQKNPVAAQADAQRALQLAPRNEDAIATLAGVYKSQGKSAEAQALIERAIRDIPNSVELHFLLAQLYLDSQRHADAEGQFRKIIELQPKNSSHRIRLAQFYVKSNQADAAETTLRNAIKDFPDDEQLKLALVDFLRAQRGFAAAETEMKQMVAAAPQDYALQFSLAELYRAAGRSAQAETVYRNVIAKFGAADPSGLKARNLLAEQLLQQNSTAPALSLVNEVIAQNPRDNDALVIRSNIALARNDPRSAIVDLRQVLHEQPDNAQVIQMLVSAHLAAGEPQIAEQVMAQAVEAKPSSVEQKIDFSMLLGQLGKFTEASKVIADAVKQSPSNLKALDTQFRIAMTLKDLPLAGDTAARMVKEQPKVAIGYMYQGTVAEALRHYDDALESYTAASNLEPNAPEPLDASVRVLAATHRLPEAEKKLDDAAAKYSQDARPIYFKGQLLAQTGHLAEAKETFRKGIARAPKWWPLYRGVADVQLLGKEDLSVIIAGLRQAKTAVDQTEQLSAALAELLARAGKPDEAVAEYEDALRKDPKSDAVANNLAMLLVTYRTDAASLGHARDLVARFANSPSAIYRDTYGWVLYKRGEAAAAVPVLERIVAENPNAAIERYHLGMAEALAGNAAAARSNLERAVGSGQRFAGLDEAKTTLEGLSKQVPDAPPRT